MTPGSARRCSTDREGSKKSSAFDPLSAAGIRRHHGRPPHPAFTVRMRRSPPRFPAVTAGRRCGHVIDLDTPGP